MMKPQRFPYVPSEYMKYGRKQKIRKQRNYSFATFPHQRMTVHFRCITAYGKSCSKKVFPKMRLLLFTMQTRRLKKMNFSKKCEAVMSVCFSALPRKWVQGANVQKRSMPRTTLTAVASGRSRTESRAYHQTRQYKRESAYLPLCNQRNL